MFFRLLAFLTPGALLLSTFLHSSFSSFLTAIATEENRPARLAVQKVAKQRRIVSDPGPYNQKINLAAWEHADFQRQLSQPAGAMDHYCGPGFERLYASVMDLLPLAQPVADNLMLSCLLKSGVVDGFLQRTVTPKASLTRGLQGVAAVRVGTRRIHSDLLWVPVLTLEQRQQEHVQPSTTLPLEMPKYLLAQEPNDIVYQSELDDFVREWEEFLYKVIVKKENRNDASRWVLLNAACTEADREELAMDQKLIATTCNDDTTPEDALPLEECCSFYDPDLKPVAPRK